MMRGNCTIKGCVKPLRSATMCAMHWNKFKRHGSPMLGRSKVTHGDSKSAEYGVWEEMHQRCKNTKNKAFPRYGGRGIRVCKRWKEYSSFIADMGKRPTEKHTLERINNSLGYSPSNCKWATRVEQQNNMRRNRIVIVCGKEMTVAQAARLLDVTHSAAYWRFVTSRMKGEKHASL